MTRLQRLHVRDGKLVFRHFHNGRDTRLRRHHVFDHQGQRCTVVQVVEKLQLHKAEPRTVDDRSISITLGCIAQEWCFGFRAFGLHFYRDMNKTINELFASQHKVFLNVIYKKIANIVTRRLYTIG